MANYPIVLFVVVSDLVDVVLLIVINSVRLLIIAVELPVIQIEVVEDFSDLPVKVNGEDLIGDCSEVLHPIGGD